MSERERERESLVGWLVGFFLGFFWVFGGVFFNDSIAEKKRVIMSQKKK